MAQSSVEASWHALCDRLHVAPAPSLSWWARLHDAYEGPGRHYHTLRHLSELLEHARQHPPRDKDAVLLAIFFHDIVYDARGGGGGNNERDSAEVFRTFARDELAGFGSERAERVHGWIVQTATHRCAPEDDGDCRLFMDFDMAILASPPHEYRAYAHAVRREYAHLSSLAWCWGRSRFLSQLARADSPPIFATPAFRAHGESAARRNAAEESASLWRQLLVLAGAGFVGVLAVLAVCIAPGALPSLLRRGGKTWLPYSHIANS